MKTSKSLTYQSPFEGKDLAVTLCQESFWMTQIQMSTLFGCDVRMIHITLKALFASGELEEDIVNKSLDAYTADGRVYSANFYNLDAIIAVGYRINPKEATHFHIWSMQMLKTHLLEGLEIKEYSIIESIRRKVSHMLAVA